jgi:Cys-tRNA(Pro)/Cys-tRNA(Cys) deacylase
MRLLDTQAVAYDVRSYHFDADEFDAVKVAELIGLPPQRVFKTLVVHAEPVGPCFAVIPASAELDLKALAGAVGAKRAELAPLRDVEALTGYVRGAVTVLAARRAYPTVVDVSALAADTIAVSGGRRGVQLVLAPNLYLAATLATTAAIARPRYQRAGGVSRS